MGEKRQALLIAPLSGTSMRLSNGGRTIMLKSLSHVIAFVVCVASSASGHQPIVSDGLATDAASAIALGDVDVSKVVYHEVTADSPQLWLRFVGVADQNLYVQLGLPAIDRLQDYRPSIAILGLGFPAIDLPFDVPAGLGGLLLSSDEVTHPTVFEEPFSNTRSWILLEQDITLPQAGTFLIVAFDPAGRPGKLWIATGREERFELDEILQLPDVLQEVRAFHESGAGLPCFLLPVTGMVGVLVFARMRKCTAWTLIEESVVDNPDVRAAQAPRCDARRARAADQ
jgi:hypothetical protein